MAGVEAHANLLVEFHAVDDGAEFFEFSADLTAFAGHGFQQYRGGLVGGEGIVEHGGDVGDALFRSLSHMTAGVEIIEVPRRIFQPLQIIGKGVPGEFPCSFLIGAGVQGVGRVSQNGRKAMLRGEGEEFCDVVFVDGFGLSAPRVAGEKLKCISADVHGGFRHVQITFGRG